MKDTKPNYEWSMDIIDFLNKIGIEATAVDGSEKLKGAFTPHVLILEGRLEVDIYQVFPGDILHEASHCAIIPARFRKLASGNLNDVFKAMAAYAEEHPEGLLTYPEDPVSRAIIQCGDTEATAWQYAAAQEVGLPDELLFPKGSFQGNAEENLLRLKVKQHYGINGLQAAGWTFLRDLAGKGLPVYPKLAHWLSPA